MDKAKRIEELIEKIQNLNYHYYTMDEPLVSDLEYDKLYDELLNLENETGIIHPYSPTQRIGGEVLSKFSKHTHLGRLWSLDKSQSFEELKNWAVRVKRLIDDYNLTNDESIPEPEFTLEYKFDGLTINLTYEDGLLTQGATRGNGLVGEGILPQLKTIKSIPLRIPFMGRIEVQGEGYMPLSALEDYNRTAIEPLKNARNAAAGALRNLDPKVTQTRNLSAYLYNVGYAEGISFQTHMEMVEFLKENRFNTFPYIGLFNNIDDLIHEIKIKEEERKDLDVLTDGMVIKINDIRTRDILGYTNKFPRWAVAYKFEAEEISTKILSVQWNVGRTAKVTPTALLEPVDIGGVTVKRATLNNYDDIIRKGVRLNGRVLIRRSNDVIPEILGSLPSDEETYEIPRPTNCPACGSDLIQNGVHMFCPNSISCKPQLVSRIVHFASRDGMNIEGFSEKTAELFVEMLDIKELSDLYELNYDKIIGLEGFKDKKTKNLMESLENSKNVSLSSFIYALGISNVGSKTAKDLADRYMSLDGIMKANYEELIDIPDVGDIVAKSILEFFHDNKIKEGIKRLIDHGISPYYESKEKLEDNIFSGKTIVITGTIQGMGRSEIKDRVEAMGGNVSGSVSKKTDFVIVGEEAGSKLDKALSLGIRIIEQDELFKILNR